MISELIFGYMAYIDWKYHRVYLIETVVLTIVAFIELLFFNVATAFSALIDAVIFSFIFYLLTKYLGFQKYISKGDLWVFPAVVFILGDVQIVALVYLLSYLMVFAYRKGSNIPLLPFLFLFILLFKVVL